MVILPESMESWSSGGLLVGTRRATLDDARWWNQAFLLRGLEGVTNYAQLYPLLWKLDRGEPITILGAQTTAMAMMLQFCILKK